MAAVTFCALQNGETSRSMFQRPGLEEYESVVVFDYANFKEILLDGWSDIEEDYVWSCRADASLRIKALDPNEAFCVLLVADAFRHVENLPSQRAQVFLDEMPAGEVTIDALGVISCVLPFHNEQRNTSLRIRLPDARRPKEFDSQNRDNRLLGLSLRRVVVCKRKSGRSHQKPYRTIRAPLPDGAATDLATKFESLGENCEFGLVQRRCGAEPLGLLRFSSAPLPKLLAALRSRFAGMGQPEKIVVELSSNQNEYMIRDLAFGFYYHAWVKCGEMTPEQIHSREKRRVPFLLRKLIEDLEVGEKIFVFHAMEEISEASALILSDAVRRYGAGTVFWVREADTDHPAGRVNRVTEGLIVGYINRFAPGEDAHDVSIDCWLDLCRHAAELKSGLPSRLGDEVVKQRKSGGLPPAGSLLMEWLSRCRRPGSDIVRAPFADVLDVFREVLISVPVDEGWYRTAYPEMIRITEEHGETPAAHFRKHGYFEGRQPFAASTNAPPALSPFLETAKMFRIVVGRGNLMVEFNQEDFLGAIQKILRQVIVNEDWYLSAYPEVAADLQSARFATATEHYVKAGYFQNLLPSDFEFDADWYIVRYRHSREALELRRVQSAKDHFIRIGYRQGCQPNP